MTWRDFTFEGSPLRREITFEDGTYGPRMVQKITQPSLNDCIEVNRAWLRADRPTSKLWHSDWIKVASVPLWLLEKWIIEEDINFLRWNDDDKARIIKRLNDFHTWGDLRTAPGQI